jgi:hypothetical protein
MRDASAIAGDQEMLVDPVIETQRSSLSEAPTFRLAAKIARALGCALAPPQYELWLIPAVLVQCQ